MKGRSTEKGSVNSNISDELFQNARRPKQSPQELLEGDRAMLANEADAVAQKRDESAKATDCSGVRDSDVNVSKVRFKLGLGLTTA